MPTMTGNEITVAHRAGKLFASVAEENGEVIHKDETHMVIRYDSGDTLVRKLGREFGVMAGTATAHELVTDLSVGDKVSTGDVVCWNNKFFDRDRLNPRQVLFKYATLARVALVEEDVTFEDASALSDRFAKKLETEIPHVRHVRIRFDQDIENLVKVGDTVEVDSIICTILNQFGAGTSTIYDEKSQETLSAIDTLTPKSGHHGIVEQIKVLYNGELEDMSETLQRLVKRSDRALSKTYELEGKGKLTGKVAPGYRVNNQAIGTDEVVIFIHITSKATMDNGDKLVISNQMKSINSFQIVDGVFETEDGVPLDVKFSYVSFMKRIVESGMVIGTTNELSMAASKSIVSVYRGNNK